MNFFKKEELKYKIPTTKEWGEVRNSLFIYINDGAKRAYTRLRWKNNQLQLVLSVNPIDYDNPKTLICDEEPIKLQNQIYKKFWEAYKDKQEKLLKAWGNFEDRVNYHKDKKNPNETDEEYQDFLRRLNEFNYIDKYNCTKCPTVEGRIIPLKKWDNQEIIYGGEKWKCKIIFLKDNEKKADFYIKNKYDYHLFWREIGKADQKNIYEQITGDKQEIIESKSNYCRHCGGKL